jgi:RiboL-PSP-HEPN
VSGRAEVARLTGRLNATFARRPAVSSDIEIQADFARYACVLVSGFLENALIALLLHLVQRRSAPEVSFFVERQLEYWTNPTCEKICRLLGDFNPDWQKKAEDYLVDERKAAINSLVALRHKIAHGESVGTSIAQVTQYYVIAQDVVQFIANLLDPPAGALPLMVAQGVP